MYSKSRFSIPVVVEQYVEEATFLWMLRDSAVGEPHYALFELADLDNRVEAHVNGIVIAGNSGAKLCADALGEGEPGEVFLAAVLALRTGNGKLLGQAIDVAEHSTENRRALISAAGWADTENFQSFGSSLLRATSAVYQYMGVGGYAVQREDPGNQLPRLLASEDLIVRARAMKAVGELQRTNLLPTLQSAADSDDSAVSFWATRSAAMLGDENARKKLPAFIANPGFHRRALQIYLRMSSIEESQSLVRGLAGDESTARSAMWGAGVIGDPSCITSLISRMEVPPLARVAGEAFSMITGVDLAYEDLDLDEPLAEMGPTDDPEDENVEMDEDEDLPWPDKALVTEWWQNNQARFRPGRRYLCGREITGDSCQQILRDGFQRQRIAAALELTLMEPGTPLFEWRAPGFRQQEWLGIRRR